MNAEKFCYLWLKIIVLFIIISGSMLALLSGTTWLKDLDRYINHIFFADQLPSALYGWVPGVMGVILTAWGFFVLHLVCKAMKKKDFYQWKCIFYSLIFWFIIDNTISIYYHAVLNIIINCIFFFQIAAPLLFLRNLYKQNSPVSL